MIFFLTEGTGFFFKATTQDKKKKNMGAVYTESHMAMNSDWSDWWEYNIH